MASHQLKLNPCKTELLCIPGNASPCEDLVISLDHFQISSSVTVCHYVVVLNNLLTSHYLTDLALQVSPLELQEDRAISVHQGHSGVCSSPCHFKAGILSLAPGRSAIECHLTLATYPACSYTTCIQPPISSPTSPQCFISSYTFL